MLTNTADDNTPIAPASDDPDVDLGREADAILDAARAGHSPALLGR